MWPFKKKEVIDFTKRKIPIRKIPGLTTGKVNMNEYEDLTSNSGKSSSLQTSDSALGFLGSLASSGSSSSSDFSSSGIRTNSLEIKDALRKIDDFEFKLGSLGRRIDSVLDRLDVVEKKLDRLERGR